MDSIKKIGRGRPPKPALTLDGTIPEYIGIMDALSLAKQFLNIPMSYRWFRTTAENPDSGMPCFRHKDKMTPSGTHVLLFKWPELKAWLDTRIERVGSKPCGKR